MMILLIGLLPLWGASAYFRCSDAVVRRYLVGATTLMLGWMILVLVKYSTDFPLLTEYGWYLFYVPMIFLPLLSMLGVWRTAGFDARAEVKRLEVAVGGVSIALALVVLTNGIHKNVFRFERGAPDFSSNYTYGPLYFVVMGWILTLFLMAGAVLLMVARRGLHQAIFLLTLVVLFGVLFGVLYVQRVQAVFASNISLVFVILFTVITEISLQLGLLPSLSWSSETFRALPLDLRLVSNANEDVIRTGDRPPLSSAQVTQIFWGEGADPAESDLTYRVFPVAGGHGVLATDVSVLRVQARELQDKQVVLRSKNLLLERDHEIQSRLATLRYEAQFLEDVESGLESTSEQIQQLLEALSEVTAGEERARILERVRLLVSYSKARGRLVLAEHEGGLLTSEHLELLVAQSASDLRAAGIECALMHDLNAGVSTRVAALLYDCLFDFALASLDCVSPVVLIHLSDQSHDDSVELRVAHGCDSAQVMDYKIREGTDNLIRRLRGTFTVEGGPGALTLKIKVPAEAGGTR